MLPSVVFTVKATWEMTMKTSLILVTVAAMSVAACGATTRGAATGATMGAVAGAVIGNNTGSGDARTGALIGGAIGGAAGAYAGCRSEGGCRWEENNPNHSQLYLDRRTNRYYYLNERDGCSYWQNGEPRAC